MARTKENKINNKAKTLSGTVVSLKMQGTAIVEVERKVTHPLYKKVMKRNKRYKVDTNSQEIKVDEKVIIVETKPLSKGKYFKVERKLS